MHTATDGSIPSHTRWFTTPRPPGRWRCECLEARRRIAWLCAFRKLETENLLYTLGTGIPGAIVNNVWKRSQRQWDRNFFTQGSFLKSVSPRYDILINAKYAHDRMRYLNPDTTLMYIDNSFTQQEAYLSLVNKYALLTTGISPGSGLAVERTSIGS